jgi:dihydroorotate dehydrogenase
LDGLVATNTTIGRDYLSTESKNKLHSIGMGGLSGKPLRPMATEVLRYLRHQAGNSLPIISSGGIMSGEDGADRLRAGADLIQIWTGFIYRGPALIQQIGKSIHSSKQP